MSTRKSSTGEDETSKIKKNVDKSIQTKNIEIKNVI